MSVRWCIPLVAAFLLTAHQPAIADQQSTATFLALGSDPGEVLGSGREVYFDDSTADFYANRTSGVGRQFVTVVVMPKDHTPILSFSFATPEHSEAFIGQTFVATEGGGWNSATIDIAEGGRSCGARTGWFVVREITAAPPGFEAAVDFEARCPGSAAGAYGRLRVRSRYAGASISDFLVPAISPIPPGTTLRFRAVADAGVPLEFKFLKFSSATGTWTVVQDYSFRPAWTWTPTVGDLGDYSLQVWVRARGSTQPFDDWRASPAFTIAIAAPRLLALQPSVPLPAPAGSTIRWTAVTAGGSLPLEYSFVRYSPGLGRWLTERMWDPSPEWEQHTTPLDEGVNTLVVAIRSRGSAEMEATGTTTFELGAPPATYVLTSLEDTTGLLHAQQIFYPDRLGQVGATSEHGLSIAASNWLPYNVLYAELADATGGVPGPGRYDDTEPVADAIAGVPHSLVVTTQAGVCASTTLGRYRILEMSSDASGVHIAADIEQQCRGEQDTLYAAVRINSSAPIFNVLSLTSDATGIVGPGAVVTWTADASSGAGPVEYRFLRYSVSGGAWTIVRDWDRDPTFRWPVSASDYGAYYLQVWARTVGSLAPYQGWAGDGPFTVASVPVGVFGLHVADARPSAGQPIRIAAVAGGGSGDVEYRFFALSYATGQWSMIRDYAAANIVDWTPAVGDSGAHALQVWVRERGSTSPYDAWQGMNFEVAPARLLMLTSQPGDPVGGGGGVTLSLPARVSGSTSGWISAAADDDRGEWTALVGNGWTVSANGWSSLQTMGTTKADSTGAAGIPTLTVRHSASTCPSSTGHVTIHEVAVRQDGSLERAAIDFDQLCDGAGAPLYGGLRLNSDVGLVHALSVVPSSTTPVTGLPITVTGNGSSATGPVEYRFLLLDQGTGQWRLLREYARERTVDWMPPAPGAYVVQLWIRRIGAAVGYESYVSSDPIVVR